MKTFYDFLDRLTWLNNGSKKETVEAMNIIVNSFEKTTFDETMTKDEKRILINLFMNNYNYF